MLLLVASNPTGLYYILPASNVEATQIRNICLHTIGHRDYSLDDTHERDMATVDPVIGCGFEVTTCKSGARIVKVRNLSIDS